MPVADFDLPRRLLAGGGPGSPDPRVLRSLTTPLIGQFDPSFTAIMDDVMALARRTFITDNVRCFAVSGLAPAGLEAVLNTLIEDGDRVAVAGSPRFLANTAALASRYHAQVQPIWPTEQVESGARWLVVPHIDPGSGELLPIKELAERAHAHGARVIVEATLSLGAVELRVDDWGIDACVAGADYALGAPSGTTLVTYSEEVEAQMVARHAPPRTSYLDLLQLQAYWSPERLNHHTAPTSLIYGLHEALRLLQKETLAESWNRHEGCGTMLREKLAALGTAVGGDGPYAIVRLPASIPEVELRRRLLEDFGVHVSVLAPDTWRIGLLGADARPQTVRRVLLSIGAVLADA